MQFQKPVIDELRWLHVSLSDENAWKPSNKREMFEYDVYI